MKIPKTSPGLSLSVMDMSCGESQDKSTGVNSIPYPLDKWNGTLTIT